MTRKFLILSVFLCVVCSASCGDKKDGGSVALAERNIERAIVLVENAVSHYSQDGDAVFSMTYNPFTLKASENIVSIWEYTSAIEAVTAVMNSIKDLKASGRGRLYDEKFSYFASLLESVYSGMDYYKGTFTLTSYTGTAEWSPYGVHRASVPGEAKVEGRENVYDDQMWIIRELINAWRATGESKYLEKAEYLAAYVLDGWDCTLDADGVENGGITWGPGYVSKHSCSNAPMISPLVWLSEIYGGKPDEMSYGVVDKDGTRSVETAVKADYYLGMAVKIYEWQKAHLLREDGVYDDMLGGPATGDGKVEYETVNGERYRKNTALMKRIGPAYSYNSGTMLSGAADLYSVTGDESYLGYVKTLTDASFTYFAELDAIVPGLYAYDETRNRPWFNDVLLRGFIASSECYEGADVCVKSFQDCLDYAWDNHLENGTLPADLLSGWDEDNAKNDVNLMFTFAHAAEYATLASYHLGSGK